MEGEHRALDEQGDGDGPEKQGLEGAGVLPEFAGGDEGLNGGEIEGEGAGEFFVSVGHGDHGKEHKDGSGKGVEEEFDGGIVTIRPTPDKDHDCHGDESGFEKSVEKDEVEAGEDADHGGFEQEHHGEVNAGAFIDIEAVDIGEQGKEGGEEDQPDADAIDAEFEGDSPGGDPFIGFGKLELESVGVEGSEDIEGGNQGCGGKGDGEPLDRAGEFFGNAKEEKHPEERDHDQGGDGSHF